MDSRQRKVIKSEDVRYVDARRTVPGSGWAAAGGRKPAGAKDAGPARDPDAFDAVHVRKMKQALKEAHDKGFAQGVREGREQQKQETLKGVQALNALTRDLSGAKKKILESAEAEILQLALAVSEKVIHMETQTNREIIRGVLRDAIKSIVDRENMKVRVNPKDFAYMMEIKPDFLRSLDGVKNIVFQEDASILRGGAVIETLFGEVDARLDQQYHRIKSSLTEPPHSG